jgi:hypothetical protein
MWRILITLPALTFAVALDNPALGQDARQPYGPFDAIAEGTRNSELRNLSLIDSQLDAVDQLRSGVVSVAQPRVLLGGPGVAVIPYGRRGILGLRPQGYVVMRRAPVVAYRRPYVLEPPPPPLPPDNYRPYVDESVRQPLGHESLQTGPNRWEYRPLYADDDRRLDEIHRDIERDLRLEDDVQADNAAGQRRLNQPAVASEPEELPVPREAADESPKARSAPPVRGQARDIARTRPASARPETTASPSASQQRPGVRVPPPPQPDPAIQPPNSLGKPEEGNRRDDQTKKPAGDPELRGPLLQNPATGAREF